jgi:hypothetical protein
MKTYTNCLLSLFLIATTAVSFGQKTTEMFIPIGQSPGVSGTQSVFGHIQSLSLAESTCTVATSEGDKTVELIGDPVIYLDYSKLNKPNKYGEISDITVGCNVELKFLDNEKRDSLDWIKIEMKSPN